MNSAFGAKATGGGGGLGTRPGGEAAVCGLIHYLKIVILGIYRSERMVPCTELPKQWLVLLKKTSKNISKVALDVSANEKLRD